jgi:hypothetical protein
MGRTYTRFRVNNFPVKAEKDSVVVALGENHLHGNKAQTKMTLKGENAFGCYEKYSIYHEFVRHTHGRTYDGQDFDEFYQKNTFDGFYDRGRSELVCAASKRPSRSLIDALNEKSPERFNFDLLRVEFEIVKSRLQDVRGIWLANMAQPFLDTAALFGKNVQQSDWYRTAEVHGGEPSSFLFFYLYNSVSFPIILSTSCSITFLRPENESLCFEVMADMDKTLLDGAVTTIESSYNQRKRKAAERAAAKAIAGPKVSAAADGSTGLFPSQA